ncbi:MAG: ComEC/Rec2 family competence protein [Chitinophagaceae bacterium]
MPERLFIPIWATVPFIRITLPFALGIVIADSYELNLYAIRLGCIGCLVVLALLRYLTPFSRLFVLQPVKGGCLFLLLILSGVMSVQEQRDPHSPNWYGHVQQPIIGYTAIVTAPLAEKKKTYQTTVELTEVMLPGRRRKRVNGKLLLYLSKKGGVLPSKGELIHFSGQRKVIQNSEALGQSDRKKRLARQNIYDQLYLDSGFYSIQKRSFREAREEKFIEKIRLWVVMHLKNSIGGSSESGLAEALLIGYREDLDPELLQAYANTGVIHVIAISGLHLSLIYSLLASGLQLLMGRKKNSLLYLALILTGVWSFSLIAGCGPSIMRAAVMFSLGAVGPYLSRRNQTLNHVFASAFVLLWMHPEWLFDLGFQLSYGAILSIMFFYPTLFKFLSLKNPLLLAIWKLAAVTLSAQLLTFPVILYTFHQWPMYFFITNLVAVPLSSLLLVGIILLCCIAPFPAMACVLGYGLKQGIYLLNSWVIFWEHRPFSIWGPIPFSAFQASWVYVVMATACILLSIRKRSLLYLPLIILLGWVSNRNWEWWTTSQQKILVVYPTPAGTLIDIYIGQKGYSYLTGNTAADSKTLRTLQLSRATHAIQQCVQLPHSSGALKISVDSTDLFYLHQVPEKFTGSPTRSWVIILFNNCALDLKSLQQQHPIQQVIVTTGCSAQQIITWQRLCRGLDIPCHIVQQNTSFVMTLR